MRFARRKLGQRRGAGDDSLRIGFVPTLGCASLAAAQELGLFLKHGLAVRLSRELGWGAAKEKLLHDELDAVVAPASMLVTLYCGLGGVRRPCLTGLLLGAGRSAITLSPKLWDAGVRDAHSLARLIRQQPDERALTFGVMLRLSAPLDMLEQWLRSAQIDPERDVRVAMIPPALVYQTYLDGFLDGYCVGEPWNSLAVADSTGWIAMNGESGTAEPPVESLLVLQEFAETREAEHLRLLAAIMEAGRFCREPANRPVLARILSRTRYLGVEERVVIRALAGADPSTPDALAAGAPTRARGNRVFDLVQRLAGPGAELGRRHDVVSRIFREDLFNQAAQWCAPSTPGTPPGAPSTPLSAPLTRSPSALLAGDAPAVPSSAEAVSLR